MNPVEKQGNTELYYQGEVYGTIYTKYKGRTIRLVGVTYAQSKTSDLESGWIPLAAEVDEDKNHIVMPLRYQSFKDNYESYEAPTFSIETGYLTGGYLKGGSWADIEYLQSVSTLEDRPQTWNEDIDPKYKADFLGEFDHIINPSSMSSVNDGTKNPIEQDKLYAPKKFNKKSADKITNFNPSTDTLEIDTDSFGIDSSATFASGKNKKEVKKKLAKQDFDFLYDEKKGGLYFNENGSDKGFGEGGIIAILKGGPDLSASNLEFI
ncbi:MAG: hypothetical protein ED554_00265 [Synechococcus sp. YX04-3]|nr:MAG: hypothetical protein ED554_00265 [Synechococcus sp. YX04-3]